jgi:exonuclease VII small subunit
VSKKKPKKTASPIQPTLPETTNVVGFGYEEMLSELEAIVADAEIRLQDEENAA